MQDFSYFTKVKILFNQAFKFPPVNILT